MKYFFLGVIVPFSILLPIFFAFFNYKKLDKSAAIILYYLLLSAVISVLAEIAQKKFRTNLPLLHFYTLAELVVLVQFYKKLTIVKSNTVFLSAIQLFFIAFCVTNVFLWQSIKTYPSYTLSLGALILMLLAASYYAKILFVTLEVKTTALPSFWFNSGIFLYFSGAFFLFIFSNFVRKSIIDFDIVWNLHAAFVLIMYILFTIGFIKCKK